MNQIINLASAVLGVVVFCAGAIFGVWLTWRVQHSTDEVSPIHVADKPNEPEIEQDATE